MCRPYWHSIWRLTIIHVHVSFSGVCVSECVCRPCKIRCSSNDSYMALLILMADDDFNDGRTLIHTHHSSACKRAHTHTDNFTETERAKNMSTAHVRMRTCTHHYTHNYALYLSVDGAHYDNGRCLTTVAEAMVWQSLCHNNDAVIFHRHSDIVLHTRTSVCEWVSEREWAWAGVCVPLFDFACVWREHSVIHFATSRAHHTLSPLSLSHTSHTLFLTLFRPHVSNLFLYILWVRFCCWQFLFPLFLFFFTSFYFFGS